MKTIKITHTTQYNHYSNKEDIIKFQQTNQHFTSSSSSINSSKHLNRINKCPFGFVLNMKEKEKYCRINVVDSVII